MVLVFSNVVYQQGAHIMAIMLQKTSILLQKERKTVKRKKIIARKFVMMQKNVFVILPPHTQVDRVGQSGLIVIHFRKKDIKNVV